MKKEEQVPAHLSDDEIVDLYWARDEKAIVATDKKYGKYLYTIAYNIVHDDMDCEECLNDTYLGTWNRIPPTRPTVFHVFLSKIMRNIAIDRYRQKTAARRVPSELIVSLDELNDCIAYNPSIEDEYAASEIARVMNAYLESLSEREQLVFVCRYYYSDYISDIARMLHVSESTVRRELEKIRMGLKDDLRKEGIDV